MHRLRRYDTPKNLLRNATSLFSQLVDSTGDANAAELRAVVHQHNEHVANVSAVNATVNALVSAQLKGIVTFTGRK